jgi:dienelactone hydrolase
MIADIYRPAGAGPFPAMVLMLGVNPLPRTDEQVVTLADGIARTGIVTVVAESGALLNGEIRLEEIDNLVALVNYLAQDPSVDAGRIGFSGFCIGAVLELLAAEDDRVATRISYVNGFSVYAFASDVLRAILTQSMQTAGGTASWTPSALTREVFLRHMIEQLPSYRDRDALRRELVEQTTPTSVELQTLSPEARHLRDLLRATDAAEVDRLLAELPVTVTQGLARLSPGAGADKIGARLFLMHDRADSYLPVAGARHLADLAEEATPVTYTEFELFEHVVPGKVDDPRVFLGEMAKLYRHIQQVLHTAHYTRSQA